LHANFPVHRVQARSYKWNHPPQIGLVSRSHPRLSPDHMDLTPPTGAQKTALRGLGQTLGDAAFLGRGGVTPAFLAELNRLLVARELVKLRFTGGQDRRERAALCEAIAAQAPCWCVGAVGHTALFWRPAPEGAKLPPA
jgi:RNA-binding protein